MDKNFTQILKNNLKRLFVLSMILMFISIMQSYTSGNNNGFNLQLNTIKCYPNPAISFVNFEFDNDYVSKNYALDIYSFTGKKMYETMIINSKITLTLTNDFYRGIYVYQLRDKTGRTLQAGKFQVAR